MTATSPQAFLLSATFHGAIAAALLLFTYSCNRQNLDEPKIIELVAGEGDNFGAKVAPALGIEGGLKVEMPKAPEPKPAPPPEPEPLPVAPAPTPPPPTPKTTPPPLEPTDEATRNFAKDLKATVRTATKKAQRDIAKERAAEKKRLDDEKKRQEAEQKKMSKEEFDRLNKTKTVASNTKSGPPKVTKVDTEGIRKGVVGGSTENKKGGAGGKALRNDNDDVLAAYDALFKQRLRAAFEPPPGLSDSLKATIEVRSHADGGLSLARVTQPSGSAEFDRAVLDAVRRMQMPPRPDKKTETIEFVFAMREREG